MILHYSLAILNTNDNALSLLFFANAPMSDGNRANHVSSTSIIVQKLEQTNKKKF